MRTPFIDISFTKTEDNHIGLNSHLYLTLNELDRLLRIFAVVKYKILIITGSSSPILNRLKAETVTKARVYPKDLAVERGASLKKEILMTGAVWPASYRLSAFIEPILYSI
jgi:hypothetical protein